jgi:hypothetical protein
VRAQPRDHLSAPAAAGDRAALGLRSDPPDGGAAPMEQMSMLIFQPGASPRDPCPPGPLWLAHSLSFSRFSQ